MPNLRIEFSLIPLVKDNAAAYPPPYPATKEIPDWFKAMPVVGEAQPDRILKSVKNCPPFLEAMTCGYIIPLAADIKLAVDWAGNFQGESTNVEIVHYHSASQVQGAPFEKFAVAKILNPWLIRTPPGYSTLFQPLLNRFEMRLIPLAGLVETDIFYRNVNFPAVLTIPPGTTLSLPKGTPLVQVIPIKRDDFQSAVVPADDEAFNLMHQQTIGDSENPNFYKDNYWRKKTYQ
jgi:hypothetical protein